MRKTLLISIMAICLAYFGCEDAMKNYPVDFIDRRTVILDKKSNPLLLVVELDENGRLSLNKIETGTISDLSILSEKIASIFEDREKTGISEREIFIDPKGDVISENLKKLIRCLNEVRAKPIRIINIRQQ